MPIDSRGGEELGRELVRRVQNGDHNKVLDAIEESRVAWRQANAALKRSEAFLLNERRRGPGGLKAK